MLPGMCAKGAEISVSFGEERRRGGCQKELTGDMTEKGTEDHSPSPAPFLKAESLKARQAQWISSPSRIPL